MILTLWAIALLVAALVGSFLNVVIHRGPAQWGLVDDPARRGSLMAPRSYCPECGKTIPPWELLPVASYFLLRGRCAACGAPIPIKYPIVEFAAVVIAALSLAVFDFSIEALLAAAFGWLLLALAAIDLETGYLPDALTAPLAILGMIANAFSLYTPFAEAATGAVAGGAVFWALSLAWRRWRGEEALGLGDAKLLAGLGAWCGWTSLPQIVLAGAVLTLGAAGIAHWRGAEIDAKTAVPFGPGLCAAGIGVFFVRQAGWA